MTLCEEGYELTSSLDKCISALKERMKVNEQVFRDVSTVQSATTKDMHQVQQSLKNKTASFANLKTDMIGAMRDGSNSISPHKYALRDQPLHK